MLRSVVGALAANMMLVPCESDVPISLACSASRGNSLELGIIGTASLGGPRKPAVRQATVGGPASQATFGVGLSERKSVPLTHIRCRMTQKGSTASFHPSKVASFAAAPSTIVSTIIGGHYPAPSRCGREVRPDAYRTAVFVMASAAVTPPFASLHRSSSHSSPGR